MQDLYFINPSDISRTERPKRSEQSGFGKRAASGNRHVWILFGCGDNWCKNWDEKIVSMGESKEVFACHYCRILEKKEIRDELKLGEDEREYLDKPVGAGGFGG